MVGAGFVAFPNSFQCACSPLAHQRVCCMMTLFCLAALTMTVMLVAFVCRPCGFISLSLTPPLHFVARWAEAGGGGGFFGLVLVGADMGSLLWAGWCFGALFVLSRGGEREEARREERGEREEEACLSKGGFSFLSFFLFSSFPFLSFSCTTLRLCGRM